MLNPAKIKVLYLVTKSNWGGAQRYVYDLATAAKKAGHEVAVAYGESGELVTKLETAGIRTFALPTLTRDVRLAREWRAFWLLRGTLRN